MLASYILGIATAIANPSAGMAVIMGGSHIAQRTALKFNRTQEEAADSLALKYLNNLNYPANGLLELLKSFNREEIAFKDQIDEYALTHPISKKRINFIEANIKKYPKKPESYLLLQKRLGRIIIKLEAFLEDANQILAHYNKDNLDSKYARAIAYYKKGNVFQALDNLNEVIKQKPEDGYLYDLKGQILFESGNLKEAILAYKKAVDLMPSNNLARIGLANAIISLNAGDRKITEVAIRNLNIALGKEKNDPEIYRQLSIAYNQNKDIGKSYLALAQSNLLKNNKIKAIKYAKLAKEHLDKKDKAHLLQADDILEFAKKIRDKHTLN
jgi:predicted Zn-dependent protease